MDRLKGKVAVITGGNSGVGEATAKLFAKEGAVVVITARREAALTKVAEEIKAAGGEAFAVSTDISKPEDPERLMELVLKKYGKIDILINNAGILETGLKTNRPLFWMKISTALLRRTRKEPCAVCVLLPDECSRALRSSTSLP